MSKAKILRQKLLKSGQGSYAMQTITNDDGTPMVVGIRRIDLLELGILKQIPFDQVAPDSIGAASGKKGGKAAREAREAALEVDRQAQAAMDAAFNFLTTDEANGIRLGIQVIDAGCEDLRGAISATADECEWSHDEDGNRTERLSLLWTDLGEDFPGLIEAIMVKSKLWKDRADLARFFRPGH